MYKSLQAFLAANPAVTQGAVARAVGVSDALVSLILADKRGASEKIALRFERVTGVPYRTFMKTRASQKVKRDSVEPIQLQRGEHVDV